MDAAAARVEDSSPSTLPEPLGLRRGVHSGERDIRPNATRSRNRWNFQPFCAIDKLAL